MKTKKEVKERLEEERFDLADILLNDSLSDYEKELACNEQERVVYMLEWVLDES